jgi:hypothetical protein
MVHLLKVAHARSASVEQWSPNFSIEKSLLAVGASNTSNACTWSPAVASRSTV